MRRKRKNEPLPHKRVPIVDHRALQQVLMAIQRRRGSQEEAADFLGISQTVFSRLLNGRQNAMSFTTFSSMLESLGGELTDFGEVPARIQFFVDPPEREIERELRSRNRRGRDAFQEVRQELLERCSSRRDEDVGLLEAFWRSVLPENSAVTAQNYDMWIRRKNRDLLATAELILDELWAHPPARFQLESFLEELGLDPELPPLPEKRGWLALLRVITPLAGSTETWGVERSWREMQEAGELEDYLRIALRKEKLLLDREHDLERFRRHPAPMSYGEWLGMVLGPPDD